jgi:MFS superfamily sulfate permease-like transporter
LATLVVGVLTIGVMLAGKRWLPKWPAPLLAVVFAVMLVYGLDLEGKGVAVVGQVPRGLPWLRWPEFDPELVRWRSGRSTVELQQRDRGRPELRCQGTL